MRNQNVIISILILFQASIGYSQTPVNDMHWQLEWKDDFTDPLYYKGQDSNGKWWIYDGLQQEKWQISNVEQFQCAPNLFLENQVTLDPNGLVITTEKLAVAYNGNVTSSCTSPNFNGIFNYASGNIVRYANFPNNIQYGYIEAKIKIEKDVFGLWPAFWMWNDDRYNPNCSSSVCPNVNSINNCTCMLSTTCFDYDEIDIFEMTPGSSEDCQSAGMVNLIQNKNITRTNIHTCDNEVGCTLPNIRGLNLNVDDYTQWHTYSVEWSPSKIIYYIDDKIIRNSINPGFSNSTAGVGDVSQKLNIIIGAGLNGFVRSNNYWFNKGWNTINDEFWENGGMTSYFDENSYSPADINNSPVKMFVQYVSYYKLNINSTNCNNLQDQIINSSTINSFDDKIDKSYTTSGSLNLPSSKIWRASEFILINSEFSTNGNSLYLDVSPCTQ